MNSSNIDWNDVIKKEARGMDDEDFGEVQNVQDNYVLVQKGISSVNLSKIVCNIFCSTFLSILWIVCGLLDISFSPSKPSF
jgi:hypothetical protein